jgi:hypothetical protein
MGVFSEFMDGLKTNVVKFGNRIGLGADDDEQSSGEDNKSRSEDNGTADPSIMMRTITDGKYPTAKQNEGDPNLYYTKEIESVKYMRKNEDGSESEIPVHDGSRPYSIFNKYSLMNFKGSIASATDVGGVKLEEFNKIDADTLINPTATKIVEFTAGIKDNLGYRYNYADFALCRYFGKIPANQMITLRRFPFPVMDDIITPKELDGAGNPVTMSMPDIARAITWMGEAPGNALNEILGFKLGFEYEEIESKIQEMQAKTSGRSGTFGAFVNNNPIAKAAYGAVSGQNAHQMKSKEANANFDSFKATYPNHVFGPLNVIKQIYARKQGLKFEQSFTLKFEYEMRSLGGANPKVMMLDQLSNILALTYNNAPFWGGSTRWTGDGSVAKPLGDIEKLKNGDISGFFGSVVDDVKSMFSGQSFGEMLGKGIKNIIGGKLMEMMNTPQGGQAVQAFLSGDPTGQWHLTVGNPLNPMLVMGNLCCENTDISFEGPLGVQDFPERMVVTITLKPGRPRDKTDVENMFNCGKGRFYLQPKEGVDIDKTVNTDAYGKAMGDANTIEEFRKITNG